MIRNIKGYVGIQNVFVGGIAATIMPERFLEKIPNLQINTGQITSSRMLGMMMTRILMIIPGFFEPLVRTLSATIPKNESHIFR